MSGLNCSPPMTARWAVIKDERRQEKPTVRTTHCGAIQYARHSRAMERRSNTC
jgi:hypothetical protein